MKIDSILNENIADEAAKLAKEFEAKKKQVPAVAKQVVDKINSNVAAALTSDPSAAQQIPDLVTDTVNKLADFRTSYRMPKYAGDFTDKQALTKYATDAVTRKYQEEVYGMVNAADSPDAKPGTATPQTTPDGTTSPQQSAMVIPADIQKQLDALTPQERSELVKALAT
jgi:hypothetical protein